MLPLNLDKLHLGAGIFHLGQAAAIGSFISQDPGTKTVILNRKLLDRSSQSKYYLSLLVPWFPFLASLDHFACFLGRDGWYKNAVETQKVNPVRWAEFSASAGIMLWIVATLCGILEIRTLVSLALLNAALQYVGYLVEKAMAEGRQADAKKLLAVGFGLHAAIWVQILTAFYSALADSPRDPPAAVYSIVMVMFALFTSFGVLSSLHVFGKIKSFAKLEVGYIVLSFVSKTLLTWLVYFGALRSGNMLEREEDEEISPGSGSGDQRKSTMSDWLTWMQD